MGASWRRRAALFAAAAPFFVTARADRKALWVQRSRNDAAPSAKRVLRWTERNLGARGDRADAVFWESDRGRDRPPSPGLPPSLSPWRTGRNAGRIPPPNNVGRHRRTERRKARTSAMPPFDRVKPRRAEAAGSGDPALQHRAGQSAARRAQISPIAWIRLRGSRAGRVELVIWHRR